MSVYGYLRFLRRVEIRDGYVWVGFGVSCEWGMLWWIAGVIVVTALTGGMLQWITGVIVVTALTGGMLQWITGVIVVTALTPSLIPGRRKRLFLSPKMSDWLWDPPSFLFRGTKPEAHLSLQSNAEVKNE